jgi:hypothetical protein
MKVRHFLQQLGYKKILDVAFYLNKNKLPCFQILCQIETVEQDENNKNKYLQQMERALKTAEATRLTCTPGLIKQLLVPTHCSQEPNGVDFLLASLWHKIANPKAPINIFGFFVAKEQLRPILRVETPERVLPGPGSGEGKTGSGCNAVRCSETLQIRNWKLRVMSQWLVEFS